MADLSPARAQIVVEDLRETHCARPSATPHAPQASGVASPKTASIGISGPRRLMRPALSGRNFEERSFRRRVSPLTIASFPQATEPASLPDASHAEVFYLKKQVQAQTLMVFVLEGGEKIEGYIEWYDRNAIKVRHGGRTLIYKSCIKYLYKAGEKFQA